MGMTNKSQKEARRKNKINAAVVSLSAGIICDCYLPLSVRPVLLEEGYLLISLIGFWKNQRCRGQ